MNRTPYSTEQITQLLSSLPGWQFDGTHLVAKFKFADFTTAFAFMTRVAFEAEKLDHHPEWSNVYNRVEIKLNTHDAKGITELDIALAQKINTISQHGL